jgi:hypothetical protein
MMKPYMVFSRGCGPEDGATLIIASSVKEAKRLAWQQSAFDFDDFIDLGVRLIRDTQGVLPLADQNKLKAGIPHIVDDPVSCAVCHHWGAGLTSEGLCGNCNSYPGDKLAGIIGKAVEA